MTGTRCTFIFHRAAGSQGNPVGWDSLDKQERPGASVQGQERWTGTRQRPAGLVSLSTLGRVVPEPPGLALLKVRRDCDWNKADEMEQSISAIKGMKASNEVTASCLPTWLQERMAVWCSRGCSHLEPSRSDSRAAQSDARLAEVQRWAICFLGHQ